MKRMLIFLLVLICSSFAIAGVLDNSAGLLGYWKFDNTTGPVVDSWGDNNGTVIPVVTRGVNGIVGNAFYMEGEKNANYVDIAASSEYNVTTGTISIWHKREDPTRPREDILQFFGSATSGHFFMIILGQTTVSNYLIYNGTSYSTHCNVTADDEWHHYAITHDGTTLRMYYDEQECNSNVHPYWFDDYVGWDGKLLRLGKGYGATTGVNGTIDEFAIWNRALSSNEISSLYDYYELGLIPEIGNKTTQIFVVLIVTLLVGALLLRKK